MLRWEKTKGFTIVELLIVVVVIAILAAITIVAFNGIQNRAKVSSVKSSASQASKKLLAHAITNNDTLPADLASIGVLNSATTSYKYVFDTSVNPNIYCISATTGLISFAASSKSGGQIEGQCINNRVFNPSFETNTSSWYTAGTTGSVLTRVTSELYSGSASMQVVTSGSSSQGAFTLTRASVLPNTTYTASVWVKGVAGRSMRIELGEFDGASTAVGTRDFANLTADGSWQRLSVSRTMSATGASADIVVRSVTAPVQTFYIDGAMISEGSDQLVFGDGNSSGWAWLGATNTTTSLGPSGIQP